MLLFLKVSEVVKDHTDRGSHRSCINLHLLRRFMGTDGCVGVGGAGTGSRRNDLWLLSRQAGPCCWKWLLIASVGWGFNKSRKMSQVSIGGWDLLRWRSLTRIIPLHAQHLSSAPLAGAEESYAFREEQWAVLGQDMNDNKQIQSCPVPTAPPPSSEKLACSIHLMTWWAMVFPNSEPAGLWSLWWEACQAASAVAPGPYQCDTRLGKCYNSVLTPGSMAPISESHLPRETDKVLASGCSADHSGDVYLAPSPLSYVCRWLFHLLKVLPELGSELRHGLGSCLHRSYRVIPGQLLTIQHPSESRSWQSRYHGYLKTWCM